MPRVLLCSGAPLEQELRDSFFWREDVERELVSHADACLMRAREDDFDLIALDRDVGDVIDLVVSLRRSDRTRHTSIVVLSRGDFDPAEVEMLEAGANAILRHPPDADWDARLLRLTSVPIRRQARFPVQFEVMTQRGAKVEKVRGTVLNVSATGMLIDSPRTLHVGEDLDFRFRLPDTGEDVRGCARVVRRDPRGQHFGLEFYGLEGLGASQIEAFVETRLPLREAL